MREELLSKYTYTRQMKQHNVSKFKHALTSTDFSKVFSFDCPNEAYAQVIDICKNVYDIAFPLNNLRFHEDLSSVNRG